MTTFLKRSRAGEDIQDLQPGAVQMAAVWELSSFDEDAASEWGVRTLRPVDRTQGRVSVDGVITLPQRQRGRAGSLQETVLTYLLGALFGLAVVVAAFVGADEESGAMGEDSSVGNQQQAGSPGR